jgi:alpha-galactosidase
MTPPPAPPASGISPAVVSGVGLIPTVFYTAADRSVWASEIGGTAAQVSNGRVLGPTSAVYIPASQTPTSANATAIVFGTGTNHALWYATRVTGTWSNWRSLGGIISNPAAVYRGSPQLYSVYARGADGSVWSRDHTSSGWNAWHKLGGLLYPDTGPAAAFANGTYVLVVGLDKQLYIAHSGVTGFRPVGGRTTAGPALTAAGGALIGFARGTDNAAWYHRFIADSPGWHSMGGIYTSGLGASSDVSSLPNTPATYTVGLGLDSHVWMCHMDWGTYPPNWGRPISVD